MGKPGTLVPAACQKTIEPVSHRRDAENERGGKRRPGDRQIKDQYKEWDKDDTEQCKQRRDIKLHNDG